MGARPGSHPIMNTPHTNTDPSFSTVAAERMASRIPGAGPAEIIAGAGHFLQEEKGEGSLRYFGVALLGALRFVPGVAGFVQPTEGRVLLDGLPLAGPGLLAAFILSFIFNWNEFLFPLIVTGLNARTGKMEEAVALQPCLVGIAYDSVLLIDLDWDIRYELTPDEFKACIPEAATDPIHISLVGKKRIR